MGGITFNQDYVNFIRTNNSGFIVTPEQEPSSDYEVANKKYVDDALNTLSGTVFYYVEVTGSDATGDGSSGNPFETINHNTNYSVLLINSK